ncbi:MAG: cytochrome d ubiquinol oxidase subunit II [Gammaproteobacteria bacterium]
MFDYEIMRVIWWVLLGVLLSGFAIMDGFDWGVLALLPIVAKKDTQKRVLLNSVGAVWEGNQVWIILGAGAIFAAWPTIYAVTFSGFYLAMLLVLLTMIIRPVGFKYRSKITHPFWRTAWDCALTFAGWVGPLVFGVAVGNVMLGVPFDFTADMHFVYRGTFFGLFTPWTLYCGVMAVALFVMQGAYYLMTKTSGDIYARARSVSRIATLVVLALFLAGGICVMHLNGYVLSQPVDHFAPSSPLNKLVATQQGQWLENFRQIHWLIIVPALGVIALLFALVAKKQSSMMQKLCLVLSSVGIFCVISTVGLSMFPFILPSSLNPNHSLLVWDASSSLMTLRLMLFATVIFLPVILAYTAWVYRVMRGKWGESDIEKNEQSVY